MSARSKRRAQVLGHLSGTHRIGDLETDDSILERFNAGPLSAMKHSRLDYPMRDLETSHHAEFSDCDNVMTLPGLGIELDDLLSGVSIFHALCDAAPMSKSGLRRIPHGICRTQP